MQPSEDYSLMDGYAKAHLGKTPRQLSVMTESELAVWQSQHSYETPQFSMVEREWQRRLIVEQVKATLSAGRLGLIGSISAAFIGVVLGYFLGTPSSKDQPQTKPAAECSQPGSNQVQRPVSPPEPVTAPPVMQGSKAVQVPPSRANGKQPAGDSNAKQ